MLELVVQLSSKMNYRKANIDAHNLFHLHAPCQVSLETAIFKENINIQEKHATLFFL